MSVKSSSVRSTSTRKPRNSSRKNIREAYIDYVKTTNGLKKSQSISNLENCDITATNSSSNYLANQYSLVKRILNASSALEKLKISARGDGNDMKSSRSVNSGTPLYKTQEEYYDEIIILKKKLKNIEKNEAVTKAKLDYYENELTKKYQEIEALLDSKSGENGFSSLKYDYRQTISLKKKMHKLEVKLRQKDNELQKLESDLKSTDKKEMKKANDIMREEIQRLNKCLSDSGNYENLIKEQDINRSSLFLNSNNYNYNNNKENNKSGTDIEFKALKDENQRLTERIQKLLNENEKYKSEIEHLKRGTKQRDRSLSSSSSSSSSSAKISKSSSIKDSLVSIISGPIKRKPSPSVKDSNYDLAVDILQSVFRGHGERLKFNNENKDLKQLKKELIEHKKQDPSPSRNKTDSPSLSRHNSTESLSKGSKKNDSFNNKLNTSLKQSKTNKSFNDEDDFAMD
jgi:hypothetical protein